MASRSAQKAGKFGDELSIPNRHSSYEALLADPQVQIVYIATPQASHLAYTILAARAGKHILCEKPLAATVQQSARMVKVCQQHRVQLMTAYRKYFESSTLYLKHLIESGELGRIDLINTAFSELHIPGISPPWMLEKKEAGGGPLMDVGVYSLNACRYLTGEEPGEIKANASTIDHDGRFDEVEENDGWTMKFPSGILASCTTTYGGDTGGGGFFKVHGSKGWIAMEPAFPYQGKHLTAHIDGGQDIDEPEPDKDPWDFVRQADHLAECVWSNREPKTPGEEGLRDITLMSQIYLAAGLKGL